MESGNDIFSLKESSPTSLLNAHGLHHPNTFLAAPISEKHDGGSRTPSAFDQRQQNTASRFTSGSKTKRKTDSKRNQNKTNKVSDPVPTLSDGKLEKMTIKELNKYIQGIPKQQAQKIKKRRRILKNRKYALKCRLKTVQKRTKMAKENRSLEKRISAAKEELKTVTKQRDYYKSKYLQLHGSLESEFA